MKPVKVRVSIKKFAIIVPMDKKSIQPLKGFRDRYPEDKALQEYIFNTVRSVAALYGFQEYDGPLVEPIELYEGKTSRELLEEQAFTLKDRKGNTLMLRPEMTPSLARMVAARSQELVLPVRFFNIGLRYRYEAPQKGRDREFYQLDFDILGSDSQLADIELLAVIVDIFSKFGATEKDFVIYINSREVLNSILLDIGIESDQAKQVISVIDRKDKMPLEAFEEALLKLGVTAEQVEGIKELFANQALYTQKFEGILALVKQCGIEKYIQVNPAIVRGLDYYTGIVFEVKSRNTLGRSLLGGGRYDNLVGMFGTTQPIPGVGFATSDTILREFLEESKLLPTLALTTSQVLVTTFSKELQTESLKVAQALRQAGISTEIYPDATKLPKQFSYANKKNIPFVIVIGPDELEKGVIVLKDMSTGDQKLLTLEEVIQTLS
jgi:histidyl-tRNA synthetase